MTTPHKLIAAAEQMAATDFEAKVPEYHPSNTGESLARRVNHIGIATHFKGDQTYLRRVYSAAYWWESMQARREEALPK